MSGITLKFLNGLIGDALELVRTYVSGTENTPARQGYNFIGAGVAVADNSSLNAKDVTIAGIAGSLSSSTPAAVAASGAAGMASTIPRSDHVHAHGTQTDPTMHAAVIASGNAGFMSGTDKQRLDDATAAATASKLCARGSSKECAFGALTADSFTLTSVGAGLSTNVGVVGHGTPINLNGSTNATAGHDGGDINITMSPGGTPGTDQTGALALNFKSVSGTTAETQWWDDASKFFAINLDATYGTKLAPAGTFTVLGSGSNQIELANGSAALTLGTLVKTVAGSWKTELHFSDQGGLSRGTLSHLRREKTINYAATGTSPTILQIPVADWPILVGTKKFVANVVWTFTGYDHGNDTVYVGMFRSTVKCTDTTTVVVLTGGTGCSAIGTADDGTGGVNPVFHITVDGSNNVNSAVATSKSDSIDWTAIAEVQIISSG
jgi:hypothetical protein